MADEQAKQRLEKERTEREKAQQEQLTAAADCKPTPTQAENDAFRSGAMDVGDPKEADGSPEETEMVIERVVRPMPASPGASYQTRTTRKAEQA